jgi:hypothetical protein
MAASLASPPPSPPLRRSTPVVGEFSPPRSSSLGGVRGGGSPTFSCASTSSICGDSPSRSPIRSSIRVGAIAIQVRSPPAPPWPGDLTEFSVLAVGAKSLSSNSGSCSLGPARHGTRVDLEVDVDREGDDSVVEEFFGQLWAIPSSYSRRSDRGPS